MSIVHGHVPFKSDAVVLTPKKMSHSCGFASLLTRRRRPAFWLFLGYPQSFQSPSGRKPNFEKLRWVRLLNIEFDCLEEGERALCRAPSSF